MIKTSGVSLLLLAAGAAVLVSGCSNISESHEYYKARPEAKLEVPPGLDRPLKNDSMEIPEGGSAVTYSSFAGGCEEKPEATASAAPKVMPELKHVTIHREGPFLWLVVNAEPELVWPAVTDYFSSRNLTLSSEDTELGLMETDWAELQSDDGTAPLRYRYNMRFEYGKVPGATEVYLSRREQYQTGGAWVPSARNAEQEAVALKKMAAHLGASDIEFKEINTAIGPVELQERGKAGGLNISVQSGFMVTWNRVIKAVESMGAKIQDRNQNYRYLEVLFEGESEKKAKSNWMGSVLTPSEKHAAGRFRLEFFDRGDGTTDVMIQDLQGKATTSGRAKKAMEQLEKQLSDS